MRFGTLAGGIGLALGVAALAVGLFGDGFGRKTSAPQTTGAANALKAPPPSMPAFQDMGGAPLQAAMPAATPPPPVDAEQTADTPPNYIPREMSLYEAHWQGMDVMLLDEEKRRKLKFPRGLEGLLIGEVTLSAAKSGLLGGDVVIKVEDTRVVDIEQFQQATRAVRGSMRANVTVLRKTDRQEDGRFAMRRITAVLSGDPDLGFAQVEAAPMILAGSPRPHPYRGVCTKCHAVGQGFELTPDPDMITLPPPPISREIAEKRMFPHENMGPCEACHVIK
nr:LemA [uncultured bacterium]